MIVELNVPYADKDKAKSLGARWNSDKKVWYVVNPPNIILFLKWVPGAAGLINPIKQALTGKVSVSKTPKKPKNRHARRREARRLAVKENAYIPKNNETYRITGPETVDSCLCHVFPWQDCEHTLTILD